ncbi:hypothetical protein EJB05_31488, partial [Eragrostis curvula]
MTESGEEEHAGPPARRRQELSDLQGGRRKWGKQKGCCVRTPFLASAAGRRRREPSGSGGGRRGWLVDGGFGAGGRGHPSRCPESEAEGYAEGASLSSDPTVVIMALVNDHNCVFSRVLLARSGSILDMPKSPTQALMSSARRMSLGLRSQ